MYCYLTIESKPRYKNSSFFRLALALQSSPSFTILLVTRKTPLSVFQRQLQTIKNLQVIVVTSEFMKLLPAHYTALCSTCLSVLPTVKRVMFISDVEVPVLENAKRFQPHKSISLAGYLLEEFSHDTSVFLPHFGLPFAFSKSQLAKVFVPSHHFQTPPSHPRLKRFYNTRIQIASKILCHHGVIFQAEELIGQRFYQHLGKYRACLTTIPSEAYPYLVGKMWEIMSVGSLLLACLGSKLPVFESLGFKDGVHYISVTEENVREKLDWVLDAANESAVEAIRRAGYELVQFNHLPKHRVTSFNVLCKNMVRPVKPPSSKSGDSVSVIPNHAVKSVSELLSRLE